MWLVEMRFVVFRYNIAAPNKAVRLAGIRKIGVKRNRSVTYRQGFLNCVSATNCFEADCNFSTLLSQQYMRRLTSVVYMVRERTCDPTSDCKNRSNAINIRGHQTNKNPPEVP